MQLCSSSLKWQRQLGWRWGSVAGATVAAVWRWWRFTVMALQQQLHLAVVATWRRQRGGDSFAAAAVQQSTGGGGGGGSLAASLAAAA